MYTRIEDRDHRAWRDGSLPWPLGRPPMATLFSDTDPAAEQVLIALLRHASVGAQVGDVGADERGHPSVGAPGTSARRPGASEAAVAALPGRPPARARAGSPRLMGRCPRSRPMLPEPLAVTLQVIDALEQVGATYVIGGSLASTIHGVVRSTLDSDIVADLSLEQAQPLADLLAGAFYLDRRRYPPGHPSAGQLQPHPPGHNVQGRCLHCQGQAV